MSLPTVKSPVATLADSFPDVGPSAGNRQIRNALASVSQFGINTVSSATYTQANTDELLQLNATSNNVNVTMLPSASCTGLEFVFKRIDSSANTVTLTCQGSDHIDAGSTLTIGALGCYRLVSTGMGYVITAKF